MTPSEILEWMFVIFCGVGLASILVALISFLWAMARDIWRG